MANIEEVFIQDLATRPQFLCDMLRQVGRADWEFCENSDVVNQEFFMGHGRIDVVATFNGKTCLAIVETKVGLADVDALEQLNLYMKYYTESSDLKPFPVDKVVGLIVAEDFQNTFQPRMTYPERTFLFRFAFNSEPSPFQLIDPSDPKQVPERPRRKKVSEFVELEDHAGQMVSDLRPVFHAAMRCFLSDDRRRWIVVNPKGGHIAIHYKGQRFLCVWPDRESFCVQDGDRTFNIKVEEWRNKGESSLQDLKKWVADRCDEIDRETWEIVSQCKWQQRLEAVNCGPGQP